MPPKKDPTINFSSSVTVNLTDRNNEESNLTRTGIPPTQQIADVINLCQSFFNQENTETAIALIKGSRIVQDNAIEMRNAIESLYNAKNKESKTHQEKIRTASQRLKEQMILANATQKHKAFEAVLALVFESDRRSIEYLSTFHSVLGMALQHSKMFSERVNVDMKRTRLLKRALNEIVDEDNSRMHEFSDFSEKRSRSVGSPSPVNVFLGSSDDERTEPARRLNNIMSRLSTEEEEVDIARNAMKTARHTLRQPVGNNYYADNDYDSECTERARIDTEIVPGKLAPHPVARPAEDLMNFDAPAPHHAADSESLSHHGVVGYSDSSVPPAAPRADRPPALPVFELQLDRSPLSVFSADSSTAGESFAMDTDNQELSAPAVQMRPVQRQQPPANTWASQVMGFLSPTEPVQLSDV